MNTRNRTKGTNLLPVYDSDGYFNLLPGETREIIFDVPFTDFDPTQHMIIAEELNIPCEEIVI